MTQEEHRPDLPLSLSLTFGVLSLGATIAFVLGSLMLFSPLTALSPSMPRTPPAGAILDPC